MEVVVDDEIMVLVDDEYMVVVDGEYMLVVDGEYMLVVDNEIMIVEEFEPSDAPGIGALTPGIKAGTTIVDGSSGPKQSD